MKKALLIVDVQNDFCRGGALEVKDGDKVVDVINKILPHFALVVTSQDAHPKESVHFDHWPKHCVVGTRGFDFHPQLHTDKIAVKFLKGTDNKDDGYSAFEGTNQNLAHYLRSEGVTSLYICGLATDYCVKATALDALAYGFHTYVITDAVAAVNIQPHDGNEALREIFKAGGELITSTEIGFH